MKSGVSVAKAKDIPSGQHIVVSVEGREIGVFNVDGQLYALANACLHQNGPLCRGRVSGTVTATAESDWQPQWIQDGEIVVCPWHSMEFEIATGRCIAYPGHKVTTYDVRVEDDDIVVLV